MRSLPLAKLPVHFAMTLIHRKCRIAPRAVTSRLILDRLVKDGRVVSRASTMPYIESRCPFVVSYPLFSSHLILAYLVPPLLASRNSTCRFTTRHHVCQPLFPSISSPSTSRSSTSLFFHPTHHIRTHNETRRTDRIVLHHAQRPVRARPDQRAVVARHGHGQEAHCDGAGFRCSLRFQSGCYKVMSVRGAPFFAIVANWQLVRVECPCGVSRFDRCSQGT